MHEIQIPQLFGMIQLISLQGSILNEVLVSNGVAHMPVYGIASGTYIVRTIGDNGMHTQKVVVK